MNPDFEDFLRSLSETESMFLVVGAHALAVHGVPRATGDLDIWIRAAPDNADRVWRALTVFGAPVENLGFTPDDFMTPDIVIQVGLPPRRIDVLTGLSGLNFDEAWEDRVLHKVGSQDVPFISRSSLVRTKRATGRLKDLADLEALGELDRGQ